MEEINLKAAGEQQTRHAKRLQIEDNVVAHNEIRHEPQATPQNAYQWQCEHYIRNCRIFTICLDGGAHGLVPVIARHDLEGGEERVEERVESRARPVHRIHT